MENRRRLERFKMNLLSFVKVEHGDREFSAPLYMMASDICAGGIYLMTDAPLPVDTHVQIGFFLPTRNPLNPKWPGDKIMSMVETTGVVLRGEDGGMAIQFDKECRISPLLKKRRGECQIPSPP